MNENFEKRFKQHEAEVTHKEEKILVSVALSIKQFLNIRDYYEAASVCFEIIGTSTGVDRVYLFQNKFDADGNGITSQKIEWSSETASAQLNNHELQEIPFGEIESFIEPLIEGKAFYGVVREFADDKTRELLESQSILSVVVLPVFVKDQFWGFVRFDECKYERTWTEGEFASLEAFAKVLESAIERSMAEEELINEKIRMKTILDNLPFLSLLKDTNITQRKNMIAQIESQNFVKQMLNAIPDMIFYKDINSTYLGCNKCFAESFIGMSEEEIKGKTDLDLMQDKELARFFIQIDKEVFQTGETKMNEDRVQMANGKMIDVETLKTPFYDDDGKVVGLIGIARDISLKKSLQEKLSASEENFRLLFENITNGFSIYEVVLNEQGEPIDFTFHKKIIQSFYASR